MLSSMPDCAAASSLCTVRFKIGVACVGSSGMGLQSTGALEVPAHPGTSTHVASRQPATGVRRPRRGTTPCIRTHPTHCTHHTPSWLATQRHTPPLKFLHLQKCTSLALIGVHLAKLAHIDGTGMEYCHVACTVWFRPIFGNLRGHLLKLGTLRFIRNCALIEIE